MLTYVYGKNVVIQLINDHKKFEGVYISKSFEKSQHIGVLKKNHIKYEVVDNKVLDKMADNQVHQGIVVSMEEFKTYSIDEILQDIPKDKKGTIVLLDQLEDPHNLGAILRTCDALQVDGVIIGKNRSVGLNSTVAKVSTGAINTVKV
ncbi:MAG: RNA methyltransferase substrate-binding domain-containing protein, partial [Erysipelotrichaceae bacterium]